MYLACAQRVCTVCISLARHVRYCSFAVNHTHTYDGGVATRMRTCTDPLVCPSVCVCVCPYSAECARIAPLHCVFSSDKPRGWPDVTSNKGHVSAEELVSALGTRGVEVTISEPR